MTFETLKKKIRKGEYVFEGEFMLEKLRSDQAKIYGLTNVPYESTVWLMAENHTGDKGVFVLIDKYQELFNMIELIKAVK